MMGEEQLEQHQGLFLHSNLGRADNWGSRSIRAKQRTTFAVFFSLTVAYRRIFQLPPSLQSFLGPGLAELGVQRG